MNVQNLVVHADSKISGGGGRVLKEGSSVLVRIIADKGGGRYEASVAGVRINLSSKLPQKVGSSFVGTVRVLNGQIQINQLDGKNPFEGINLEALEYQAGTDLFAQIADEAVAAFLENLGLVPDNLSYHIFNQFKQLELKIDASLINKIHNLAKKIKGKEKLAAELLTNLYKKGIEISEEELLDLIASLESYGSGESDSFNDDFEHDADKRKKNQKDAVFAARSMLNSFWESLFNTDNHKIGALTISNHILSKNESGGSWFMFPFEITDSADVLGGGTFRLFIESNQKLSQLNLNCNFDGKNYFFSIAVNGNSVSKIKMNVEPCSQKERNSIIEKFAARLSCNYKNLSVEWAQKNELEGFSMENDNLFFIDGKI